MEERKGDVLVNKVMRMKVINKVGGIILNGKKMLVVREKGKDMVFMPGGEIEKGENDEQSIRRELKEELGVEVKKIKYYDTITGPAAYANNVLLNMRLYITEIKGDPKPCGEIEEIMWIDRTYNNGRVKPTPFIRDCLVPRLVGEGIL